MKEKTSIYLFIPKQLEYLNKEKKIVYNGKSLKTAYLIDIIHDLITKYYLTNDVIFNLWSVILRKKYGFNYNTYIQYLVDKGFISMISDYFVNKKAKTYKLNFTDFDVVRCKIYDTVLLKKHEKDYLTRSATIYKQSPIEPEIRKMLVDDLYHIKIDYVESLNYLNNLRDNKEIELSKYVKNFLSVESINTGHIFYKFDDYGRMHTNFTILKKHIRQNLLRLDNKVLCEIDIKNSQPFFFAYLLKLKYGEENFNTEVKRYVDVVKNGLLYDEFLQKYPTDLENRDDAKLLIYKVLFGNNIDKKEESILFRKLYPTVYEYIKELKSHKNNYKGLSHELQGIESNFIYNTVVKDVKEKFPHIRLFTVHDSLVFPCDYKEEVSLIFRNHLKKLL